MNQQVNLYEPGRYHQWDLFRAPSLLWGAGAAVSVPLLIAALMAWHLQKTNVHEQILEQTSLVATQQLNELRARLAASPEENALNQEQRRLEKLVAYRRNLERLLNDGQTNGHARYADYFVALAVEYRPGLWLTGIHIGESGQYIELHGTAKEPGLIPQYLKRLSRQDVFAGKTFRIFDVHRPISQNGSTPLPYVEFVIATKQSADH